MSWNESLTVEKIAELPAAEISRLSDAALIDLIRAAQLPQVDQHTSGRLEFSNRSTLERLAHLSRRCCEHRHSLAN